jgi:hypothetical protein
LLWPAAGPGEPRPLDTAGVVAVRAANHNGPPFDETLVKLRNGFAGTRPTPHGPAELSSAFRVRLTTPPAEPVLAGVWLAPPSSGLQRHRGRAPPFSLINSQSV